MARKKLTLHATAVRCLEQALKDGYRQQELAKELGIPQPTICNAIKGKRSIGSIQSLQKIFDFFKVPIGKPARRRPKN